MANEIKEPEYKLQDNFWLFKDNQAAICPYNPGILRPEENGIQGVNQNQPKLFVDRLICNKSCPHMKEGIKRIEGKEDTRGLVLECGYKTVFLPLK